MAKPELQTSKCQPGAWVQASATRLAKNRFSHKTLPTPKSIPSNFDEPPRSTSKTSPCQCGVYRQATSNRSVWSLLTSKRQCVEYGVTSSLDENCRKVPRKHRSACTVRAVRVPNPKPQQLAIHVHGLGQRLFIRKARANVFWLL